MRRGIRRSLTTGAALAALVSCGGSGAPATTATPAESGAPTIETIAFAAGLGIELPKYAKTKSGGYYRDLVQGTGGAAGARSTVTVRYVVYLPNGTVVETQSAPVEFAIGPNTIPGFREGLPGMRIGGTRSLILPPSLAYGKTAYGAVPANSTLVFEIDLLKVRVTP